MLKLGEWSYAIYIGQTAWLQFVRYLEQRWYPGADPRDDLVARAARFGRRLRRMGRAARDLHRGAREPVAEASSRLTGPGPFGHHFAHP